MQGRWAAAELLVKLCGLGALPITALSRRRGSTALGLPLSWFSPCSKPVISRFSVARHLQQRRDSGVALGCGDLGGLLPCDSWLWARSLGTEPSPRAGCPGGSWKALLCPQLLPAHGPPAPTHHPTVIVPAPPPSHHVTVVTMGPSSVINTVSTSRQNLDTIVQVESVTGDVCGGWGGGRVVLRPSGGVGSSPDGSVCPRQAIQHIEGTQEKQLQEEEQRRAVIVTPARACPEPSASDTASDTEGNDSDSMDQSKEDPLGEGELP